MKKWRNLKHSSAKKRMLTIANGERWGIVVLPNNVIHHGRIEPRRSRHMEAKLEI